MNLRTRKHLRYCFSAALVVAISIAATSADAVIVSWHWAGYVVRQWQTGNYYSQTQATWTHPKVNYEIAGAQTQIVAIWTGIGGDAFLDPSGTPDRTLIQLGTSASTIVFGQGELHWAWYEMIPGAPITISDKKFTIRPGDVVTASIECAGNCLPGATQQWIMKFEVRRNKQTHTCYVGNGNKCSSTPVPVSYKSSMASAVWVIEAPNAPSYSLANFGKITFSSVRANRQIPPIATIPNDTINYREWICCGSGGEGPLYPIGSPNFPKDVVGDKFAICWGSGLAGQGQIDVGNNCKP